MFRRNKQPSAFQRCANKTFAAELHDSEKGTGSSYVNMTMECPGNANGTRVEMQPNQPTAQQSLETVVGKTICNTCVFAGMGQLDTARYRLELAQTRAAAADAESKAIMKEREHQDLLALIHARVDAEAAQPQLPSPPQVTEQ